MNTEDMPSTDYYNSEQATRGKTHMNRASWGLGTVGEIIFGQPIMTRVMKAVALATFAFLQAWWTTFAECFMNCLLEQEALLPNKTLTFYMYCSAEQDKKDVFTNTGEHKKIGKSYIWQLIQLIYSTYTNVCVGLKWAHVFYSYTYSWSFTDTKNASQTLVVICMRLVGSTSCRLVLGIRS